MLIVNNTTIEPKIIDEIAKVYLATGKLPMDVDDMVTIERLPDRVVINWKENVDWRTLDGDKPSKRIPPFSNNPCGNEEPPAYYEE